MDLGKSLTVINHVPLFERYLDRGDEERLRPYRPSSGFNDVHRAMMAFRMIVFNNRLATKQDEKVHEPR